MYGYNGPEYSYSGPSQHAFHLYRTLTNEPVKDPRVKATQITLVNKQSFKELDFHTLLPQASVPVSHCNVLFLWDCFTPLFPEEYFF